MARSARLSSSYNNKLNEKVSGLSSGLSLSLSLFQSCLIDLAPQWRGRRVYSTEAYGNARISSPDGAMRRAQGFEGWGGRRRSRWNDIV